MDVSTHLRMENAVITRRMTHDHMICTYVSRFLFNISVINSIYTVLCWYSVLDIGRVSGIQTTIILCLRFWLPLPTTQLVQSQLSDTQPEIQIQRHYRTSWFGTPIIESQNTFSFEIPVFIRFGRSTRLLGEGNSYTSLISRRHGSQVPYMEDRISLTKGSLYYCSTRSTYVNCVNYIQSASESRIRNSYTCQPRTLKRIQRSHGYGLS